MNRRKPRSGFDVSDGDKSLLIIFSPLKSRPRRYNRIRAELLLSSAVYYRPAAAADETIIY